MRIKITFTNKTRKKIEKKLLNEIVEKTLKYSSFEIDMILLSVVFLSSREIQRINKKYRKKDKPTDTLSFLYDSSYNEEKKKERKKSVEGEIFLCPGIISDSAQKNKGGFGYELAFVLSHSILHLLGMKHSQKMYALQDKVAAAIKK